MRNLVRSSKLMLGVSLAGLFAMVAGGLFHQGIIGSAAAQGAADPMVPVFQADGGWPKPLPNGWVIGSTIGLAADSHDNIWIVHRPGTLAEKESYMTRHESDCCTAAPDVLEFSPVGALLHQLRQGRGP